MEAKKIYNLISEEDFNDAKSEDAMINRIIILIENGQL